MNNGNEVELSADEERGLCEAQEALKEIRDAFKVSVPYARKYLDRLSEHGWLALLFLLDEDRSADVAEGEKPKLVDTVVDSFIDEVHGRWMKLWLEEQAHNAIVGKT